MSDLCKSLKTNSLIEFTGVRTVSLEILRDASAILNSELLEIIWPGLNTTILRIPHNNLSGISGLEHFVVDIYSVEGKMERNQRPKDHGITKAMGHMTLRRLAATSFVFRG